LQIQGRDVDGDTLTFSATGLPSGLTISSSGLISGTVASTAPSSSPYTVTVTANDGHSHTASQTFTWTVTMHVSLTNPGDQSNLDGDVVSLAITASDADNEIRCPAGD
jgi:hypothetical protein